jgi:hypothetical protein
VRIAGARRLGVREALGALGRGWCQGLVARGVRWGAESCEVGKLLKERISSTQVNADGRRIASE